MLCSKMMDVAPAHCHVVERADVVVNGERDAARTAAAMKNPRKAKNSRSCRDSTKCCL